MMGIVYLSYQDTAFGVSDIASLDSSESQLDLDGKCGVVGALGSRRFRFQKSAFGPFMIKANVQRESPRRVSGLCIAAVISVENDKMKATLGRR